MNKVKRDIKIIAQEDGAMIFDRSRGIYFQVNQIGKQLIEGLEEGKTKNELVNDLENSYGLENVDAEKDVNEFMLMLREAGII